MVLASTWTALVLRVLAAEASSFALNIVSCRRIFKGCSNRFIGKIYRTRTIGCNLNKMIKLAAIKSGHLDESKKYYALNKAHFAVSFKRLKKSPRYAEMVASNEVWRKNAPHVVVRHSESSQQ